MELTKSGYAEAVVCHPGEPDLHALKELYLQPVQKQERLIIPRRQEFYGNVQEGARAVVQRVLPLFETQDVVVIALGGPSRSGKGYMESELKRLVAEHGIGLGTLPMDWFYLLHEQREALEKLIGREVTFDDPESIWYERLGQTITALREGVPVKDILFCDYLYGAQGPVREWQKEPSSLDHFTKPKNILVIDGIFAGHPLSGTGEIADLLVHMESDGATQAVRRISVDSERGYYMVDAAHIILDFVARKRKEHVDPYAAHADIRVRNTMPPEELMQRVPEVKQVRFLPQTDPALVTRLTDTLRREMGFLNKGLWSLADVYTGIPGRSADDFARLRFVQGKKEVSEASMTISLHNAEEKEFRASYPLFGGLTHVPKYVAGLQDCMASPGKSLLVHKERLILANAVSEVHIDTDMKVTALGEGLPLIHKKRIAAGEKAVAMPLQIEVSGGRDEDIEAVAGYIRDLLGDYTTTPYNTFHRAREAV